MALTNDQLKLLESCPALVAFKDWFVEVDALLENTANDTENTETNDQEGDGGTTQQTPEGS